MGLDPAPADRRRDVRREVRTPAHRRRSTGERHAIAAPGRVVLFEDLRALALEPDSSVIYDRGIESRLLYRAPSGAPHYLIRYPAGVRAKLHRHSAAHTIVVLDGRLEANGRIVGVGAYAHFPAGEPMHHAPADGTDCLILVVFDGPLDAEPLE